MTADYKKLVSDALVWRERLVGLSGAQGSIGALCDAVESLEREIGETVARLNAGTLHVVWCNADHSGPVGNELCSCPTGKAIKDARLRYDADNLAEHCTRLEARVAELTHDLEKMTTANEVNVNTIKRRSARVAELEKRWGVVAELLAGGDPDPDLLQPEDYVNELLDERTVLETENAGLREERDQARRFGEDAAKRYNESLRVVTCAFCGTAYPPDTPASGAAVLVEHVKVCASHPMREVEARAEAAERQLNEARASMATPLRELQQLTQEREKRCRDEKGCDHELLRRLQGLLGRFGYAHDVALPAPPTVEPGK